MLHAINNYILTCKVRTTQIYKRQHQKKCEVFHFTKLLFMHMKGAGLEDLRLFHKTPQSGLRRLLAALM